MAGIIQAGFVLLIAAVVLSAQNISPNKIILNACVAGTNFETDKYRVAKVSVDDPFQFLFGVRAKQKAVLEQLQTKLQGQLFTYTSAVAESLDLIEKARFAPDNTNSFSIRVEFVYVQNCDDNAKTLEITYKVFSTDPPKFLGGATESQAMVEKSPQTTTGLTKTGSPVRFTPSGGYDRSSGLYGGGRIEIGSEKTPVFDHFLAEGWGSYSTRFFSAAFNGSHVSPGWLQHANWSLSYLNSSMPAGAIQLKQANLSGQLDAASRPFWNGKLIYRFGGLVEGGNMQSVIRSLAPGGTVGSQTIPNSGYGSVRGFGGVSSRTDHNVFSLSYGLELGAVGPSARVDWRKHVADVVDEFWIPLSDHKPLEVESRFTAGGIEIVHSVPLPSLFFGGTGDDSFIRGTDWKIRDVPVVRAIPANRFYLTGQGAGATRFASMNLTFSYPVKSSPMVPRELSTNKEFNDLLEGQIISATSVEQNYYSWKDPHFANAFSRLPEVGQRLDDLQKSVDVAQAKHPGQFADEFAECTADIGVAQFYVKSSTEAKGSKQYGGVSSLLKEDDGLQAVLDGCFGDGSLNQRLNDTDIAAMGTRLTEAQKGLSADFNSIDQGLAKKNAGNEIAFVRRTLNTLFKDLNIFSISPVVVFDSAWIGPAKGNLGGNRMGPGGGVRFELASHVNFTLGYAWNVNRRPNEDKGALFFSIGVRELFH